MNQPQFNALRDALDAHGELHVTYDGLDAELELRRGQVTWDAPADGLFRVDTHAETHVFRVDAVLSWYRPQDIYHG